MYAVIETGGKQYMVSPGDKILVELTDEKKGKISFGKVLLIRDEENIKIGNPYIKGASIKGKVLDKVKSKKVIIFKKKRRKQYKRTKGHRQNYLQVLIEEIKEA